MPLGCWRLTLHYRNGGVDIDRYIARNEPTWTRLAELTGRARFKVASLSPTELDELIQLYQRTSAQLSYARTYFHDQALTTRLTRLVADAAGVIYGKRARRSRTPRRRRTTATFRRGRLRPMPRSSRSDRGRST